MGKILEKMMDQIDEEYQAMGVHLDIVELNQIAMWRMRRENNYG